MISNNQVEESVLGVLITYGEAYYKVADKLHDDLFFDDINKWIYQQIVKTAVTKKIDVVTVTQECLSNMNTLNSMYKDGIYMTIPEKITVLTSEISSNYAMDDYINILEELYRKRSLYRIIYDTKEKMEGEGDTESEKLIDKLTEQLLTITNHNEKEKDIVECIKLFEEQQTKQISEIVTQTKISELDAVIGGFEPSDLIIVAGAASMGKTSLAVKLAINFLLSEKTVGMINLEMNDEQLMTRIISNETNIPFRRIKYKEYDEIEKVKIKGTLKRLGDTKFFLDSTTSNLTQVVNKLRKWKIRDGLDIVIIDYLQLMQCNGKGNREQEVATIVRTLKNTAKSLGITIIALSQLNRALALRENKRPTLSDLRESGEIEQAADTVIFCYREEYYVSVGNNDIQEAELIVAKGRNVGTGVAKIQFKPELTKYISAADIATSAIDTQQIEFQEE